MFPIFSFYTTSVDAHLPPPAHSDGVGKEVVSRVVWPDISTNGTFYTDANGREMIKRK